MGIARFTPGFSYIPLHATRSYNYKIDQTDICIFDAINRLPLLLLLILDPMNLESSSWTP